MECLNLYGLIFIAIIMIPNVVFAIKCKDGFENIYQNRTLEILEQSGRFVCIGFIVFNVPGTWLGWRSDEAFAIYLIVNTLLVILYCFLWAVCWKKNNIFRALSLSVLPSAVFMFSGIMSRSVLLILSSAIFAPAHIFLSYKNINRGQS